MKKQNRKKYRQHKIGIDIGRVIINGDVSDLLRNLSPRPLRDSFALTPAVHGALKQIQRLVQRFGADRVWLLSKCTVEMEEKVKKWLQARGFFCHTGVRKDHVFYLRSNPQKIAQAEKLKLTCFIDDKGKVLRGMTSVKYCFLFVANKKGLPQPQHCDLDMTVIHGWREALMVLAETI